MAVYSRNGTLLNAVYGRNGLPLSTAYNKAGEMIYTSGGILLKVMTYNVGQWYIGTGNPVPNSKKVEYQALHTGIFARNRPDVLLMQEYLNTWCADGSNASDLLSPYFTTKEVTNPQGYIGHAICTNGIQQSNYASHQFTTNRGNYPTFESSEIVVGGKAITLVNTHNDYYAAFQPQEIEDLLAFLANLESFVLCGDFNIDLAEQDASNEQYIINVKPFLDAGYNVGNCVIKWIPTYFGTAKPTGGGFTDQFVTSPNIEIANLYADTTKLTDAITGDKIDHIPLVAELIIH